MAELPFVTIKKYVKELTDEEIITFEAWDKEAQEKLYNMIAPSKNTLLLEHAYRKGDEVIFKPESVRISHKYNYLYFYIPAGQIGVPLTDELLDYIVQLRSKNIYFKVKLTKKAVVGNVRAIYIGDLVAIYEADYDFDRAKELLNEYKPIDLIMYTLGYKPTNTAIASKLAMIIPLFQYNGKAIHTATFTPPRFGKTKTASILRGLTSSYLTTMPTPSKLVYDGAKGKYGLTYFYSTLYIDEFDKIQSSKRKDIFKESYEILLTGMSEGYWTREVSSKVGDFNNLVGFCFMGNWDQKLLETYTGIKQYNKTARNILYDMLHDIVYPEPFIERLAYVEFIDTPIQAYKLLNYNENNQVMYLHPKVSRAVIKILQDAMIDQPIHKLPECELDHHFNAVKSVLAVLGIELEDDTVEQLVKGNTTFLKVLQDEQSTDVASEQKVEELDEMTLKEMLDSVGW